MDERTREEWEEGPGEKRPDQGATSLINANVAIPVNAEIVADVLSNSAPAAPDAPTKAE